MDEKNKNLFKKLLNDQLQALIKEASETIGEMSDETERENFPDTTDRAAVESDRNFLLRIRERERLLILKVRAALKRIGEGTFGICESCGVKISLARLKARAVTTFCIECKTEAEQQEKLEHA